MSRKMVWLNSLSLKLHGVRTLGFALFAVLLFFYAGFPFAAADKNPGLQQGGRSEF